MTVGAWVTLAITWSVIIGFSAKFLIAVLRKPPAPPGA